MNARFADEHAFFLDLAARIVPEFSRLDGAARSKFLDIVSGALEGKSAGLRRRLALFLFLLRWLPALRYGRPLERLPGPDQDRVLRFFEECPLPLARKGFWGVKALVYLGYYGRPEVWEAVGYRPARDGNARLRG